MVKLRFTRAGRPPAPVIPSSVPAAGVQLWLRTRWSRVLSRGQAVTVETDPELLVVSLEQAWARPEGGALELEWVDPLGLIRRRGRVKSTRGDAPALLDVLLEGPATLIQRREHLRAAVEIGVTAWSPLAPTTLVRGKTINLGGGGALLEVAGLPPAAALDVRLMLSDGPVSTKARVVRYAGSLLAVAFDELPVVDEERLTSLVFSSLSEPHETLSAVSR